jgi:hypothetical protein
MKRSILFIVLMFAAALVYGQCTYQVGLYDSYGDGWNGGLLDIYVDGVLVHDDAAVATGNGPVFYDLVGVTPGQTIACDYTAGSWAYENEYWILDGDGLELFRSGAGGVEPVDHGTWVAPFTGTVVACSSCVAPSALTESNITAATADLSWTAGGTETLWNLEYGAGGFVQGTGTMVTGLAAPAYSVSGLTEGNWDWYVQADCGAEQSAWPSSSFYAFDALTNDECSGAVAIGEVVDQPFNTTTATTSGVGTHSIVFDIWYVYTPAASGTVTIDLCGSTYDTKLAVWDDCAYTTELGYNDDDSITCTSRALQSAVYDIPVIGGEDYFLQVGGYGTNSGTGDITITYTAPPECPDPSLLTTTGITNNQADLDWTTIGTETAWNIEWGLDGFVQGTGTVVAVGAHPYTLMGLSQDTAYDWYVQADCSTQTSNYVGPASFNTLVTCPAPTALAEAAVTETSADLSWTAGLSETLWNLEYGLAGFVQGTGTMVTGLVAPAYSLSGLTGSSSYDWYVQADCGTEQSSWAMGNFATTCGIYTAPFAEDFENAGATPLCWTNSSTSGELWVFATATIGHSAPNDHTGGGYFAAVDDSESPHSTDVTLTSPLIDVSGLMVPQLSFWLYSDQEGSGLSMTLNIDVWDGAMWNVAYASFTGDTVLWEEQFVDLSALTITGPIQVKFIADETSSVAGFYDDISIDDILIDEAPACPAPTGPVTTLIDFENADLSWAAGGAELLWDVQWGLDGFTPDAFPAEGTTITGLTAPAYSLTGLTEVTEYDWYVRADCGARAASVWVGPISFMTPQIPGDCGTWTASLVDSYGDSWNGNSMDVLVNGVTVLAGITVASGSGPDLFNFETNTGDMVTTVYYNMDGNPGSTWPEENSYTILNQFDAVVGTDGDGGVPPVGITTGIEACPPICMVTVDVASFNFGGIVPPACHGGQDFIITNGGGAACNILTSAIIGTDAGVYTLTDPNMYPANLAPGASLPLPINVDFCPAAELPYPDATLEVTSDCFGYLSITSDLSGIGITGVNPDCPVDDLLFSQVADVTGWNAGTSELDPGFGIDYKCFDNYSVTADILDMRFWGLQLIYDGGFGPGSTEYPTEFLIEFWADDGTGLLPDVTAPVYSEQVVLNGTPLVDVGGYYLWEWNYTFAAPVTQMSGWVSIQGQTAVADDNWFMFMSSTTNVDGDAMSRQWTGAAWTEPAAVYDFAFCFTGSSGPITAPDGLVIEVFPGTDEVMVSWNYIMGQVYYVYSDVDPYGAFATQEAADVAAGVWVISPIPAVPTFYNVTTDMAAAPVLRQQTSVPVTAKKKISNGRSTVDVKTINLKQKIK